MENHHFQWENPLCLWPFSIAMLNYQRVTGVVETGAVEVAVAATDFTSY